MVWLVAALLQRAGECGQLRGHLARDAGAGAAGVEAVGLQPDAAQGVAHFAFGQVGQREPMAARVRKRRVGGAAAAEFRVQLNDVAHIHHQQKRRPALKGGQGARVALGLGAGAQQGVVKALGVRGGAQLFGLKHKVAAPVAVDSPGAQASVAVGKGDGALEHVALLRRGVRRFHAQQVAQLTHKALRRGQLAGSHALPAGDEGLGGLVGVVAFVAIAIGGLAGGGGVGAGVAGAGGGCVHRWDDSGAVRGLLRVQGLERHIGRREHDFEQGGSRASRAAAMLLPVL